MSSAPSSADRPRIALTLSDAAHRVQERLRSVKTDAPVVLIDGRSGSGKTSLAAELVALWPAPGLVQRIALDDLYPGWDGLFAGAERATEDVLEPLRRGEQGLWRRYDWSRGEHAEAHTVSPSLPLIVEGAGLLTARSARTADLTVWVGAPDGVRRTRALARDGEAYAPYWDMWAQQEEEHLGRNSPEERAMLRVELS